MKKLVPVISLLVLVAMTFSGCETSGASALSGAAAGAAIGGLATGRGRGAFHGAAIGAAAGYLLGKVVRNERRAREDRYDRERGYDDYPVARPTNRRGFVTSPYRPYNLIDVRGIPSGAEVVDPSCDEVFINP
jgi:predicted small secreted protein